MVEDLKQPGEPGAGEGRWPYEVYPPEVYPPEVSGVPRNWLVSAALQPNGEDRERTTPTRFRSVNDSLNGRSQAGSNTEGCK